MTYYHNKRCSFWKVFGHLVLAGWGFAIAISFLMWVSPVDTVQFPYVKPFGVDIVATAFFVASFLFGLVGLALGFICAMNYEENPIRIAGREP